MVLGGRGATALVAPAWVLLGAIIVLPAGYVFWLSFQESSFGQAAHYVGVSNYASILQDPYFWRSLRNTVLVVVCVVMLEMLIGLAVALLFASGIPARPLWLAVMLAPYAVSEVAAVVMWRFLLDPDTGPLTHWLRPLGLALDWAVVPRDGLILAGLLSTWLHLPFTFVILYAARLALPTQIYEAARVDGASALQQFRLLTLPLMRPAILVAMLFRTITGFRLFSEVWLTTQGGPARTTEVSAIYLYLEGFRYNSFGIAAATGWMMVVAAFLVSLLYVRRLYKDMADAG